MAKKKTSGKNSSKNSKKSGSSIKVVLLVVVIALAIIGFRKYKETGDLSAVPGAVAEEVEKTLGEIQKASEKSETNSKSTESKREKTGKSDKTSGKTEETTKSSESTSEKTAKATTTYTKGNIALPSGLEIPTCPGTKGAKDHQTRQFEHYALCYRESYEQAEWSAYELTKDELNKKSGRTNDFREDPEIKTGSATLNDYKGSGYDRGHLTPAADMAFSEKAMSETFYLSNMSPQAGPFNRGIWQQLEAQVRTWAKTFGKVYVVSGPILEKPASKYESIGKDNKIAIPQYYYKVLLAPLYADGNDSKTPDDAKSIAAIGFILPNEACSGKEFWDFAVSVDEVEKRTGLDFFSLLDEKAEKEAEGSFDISIWK